MKNLRLVFKNNITADFKFVDNEVGKVMHKLISEVKESTEIVNYHGSFPGIESVTETEKRLRVLVDQCSNEYNIKMPHIPDNLDRETLNRIHEDFHVVEEHHVGKHWTEVHKLGDLRKILREINQLVHKLEKHIGTDSTAGSYAVFQIGKTHNLLARQVLHSVLRKNWRYSARPGPVYLTCGYATIGKNLLSCMVDNDTELVKRNLISPQMSVSTETIWVYSKNETISEAKAEEMWQDHLKRVKNFVVKNKLQNHVGYEDPIHTFCIQPTYATLIEESIVTKKNWSVKNWHNLFENVGIERAELV